MSWPTPLPPSRLTDWAMRATLVGFSPSIRFQVPSKQNANRFISLSLTLTRSRADEDQALSLGGAVVMAAVDHDSRRVQQLDDVAVIVERHRLAGPLEGQ